MQRLVGALSLSLLVSSSFPANAEVQISTNHISVGDSLYLYFINPAYLPAKTPGPGWFPPVTGGSYTTTLTTYQFITSQNVLAAGSTEGAFNGYGCLSTSPCDPNVNTYSNVVKLTYAQPGQYEISYDLTQSSLWNGYYSYYFPDGSFQSRTFDGQADSLHETGRFTIFVDGVASPVPEPSTWAMMLLGFSGVGFLARRRRRKQVTT